MDDENKLDLSGETQPGSRRAFVQSAAAVGVAGAIGAIGAQRAAAQTPDSGLPKGKPGDPDAISEEIAHLQGHVTAISEDLTSMRRKVREGGKVSPQELKLVVRDINRLDVMIRDRQDVGH
jgi:hypothetical protein